MKNEPCVRSVADSDKSFRTHRAGYFIGQGSMDTALARGRGEHRHRKRWGQNSRTHCMGLGATTIFRSASLLLRFVGKYHGVRLGHVRRICRQHQTILAGSLGGRYFTTPFFRVSGGIRNCSIILRFCVFFPSSASYLRNNVAGRRPKTDKAEHKAVTPCEPRATYGHSRRNGIDQGDLQGHSQASMVGRRKRSATRELFSSSRQSTHRHRQDLYEIASFFLVVVGFVAPQVVSIYAREVRSPL